MSLSFFSSVSVSPYHQAEISELISSKTVFLSSKSHPQRIGWHQKCSLTTFQLNYPSPFLHTAQNILLNACSVRTFTSLTAKNGGSYTEVFTALAEMTWWQLSLLNPTSPIFYRTEKTSGGNVLQESISKGVMNPVMYGILKMVEYKVQIITLSQIFHDVYTYLLGQLCKIPNSLRFWRPPSCAALLQTKIIDSLRQYFYVFW